MAAGSDISPKSGFLVVAGGSFTLDPASIATNANADQTVAVDEARIGDIAIVAPRAALTDGLILTAPHVSADGTITFTLENTTGSGIDEGSATWDYLVIRGTAGLPGA